LRAPRAGVADDAGVAGAAVGLARSISKSKPSNCPTSSAEALGATATVTLSICWRLCGAALGLMPCGGDCGPMGGVGIPVPTFP
jgi:hypothetical protein